MSIRKTFCTALVAAACVVTIVPNASGAAPQRVCGGDPFIHLENGTYYLYFSSGDTMGLTVYTSTNLKEWLPDQGRDKFGRAYVNGNGFGSNRFWAPEMHKYKGKYYLFHSAEEKVTVDVGDSPLGPFRNPEKKPFFPEGNIDNSFFLDDDGTPYMLYAHFYAGNEVWICELEKDLLHAKPETQRKLIRAEEDWEMNRSDPRFSKWSIAEGPCLIKKDGIYWLTYSSHHVIDDNYNVCLATATNVKGPYVKQGKGPILAPKGKYQCTGHHSLFKDKSGNWKIVFHSRDPGGGPRYTYTADAKFTTKDGHPWIEIGEFQPCYIKKPALSSLGGARLAEVASALPEKPCADGAPASDRAMRPVEQVCYNEIRNAANSTTADTAYDWPADPNPNSFLGKLRTKSRLDFDLPSEAQWEFAARAGNGDTKWGDGSGILNGDADANLNLLGRYERDGGKVLNGSSYANPAQSCGATNGTAIVGSYAPNAWGLYDMHGNVWEWCLDWYEDHINAHGGAVNINPSAPAKTLSGASGASRVFRGGGWGNAAGYCRPAYRGNYAPTTRFNDFGFRVLCSAGLR